MSEKEYTGQSGFSVSETVQKTGVPSHVLRYWEEELGLDIRRSPQGHRIYSEADVRTFRWVRELKEKGIQLKAIRVLLQEEGKDEELESFFFSSAGQPGYGKTSPGWEKEEAGEDSRENEGEKEGGWSDADSPKEAEYEIIPTAEADNFRRFETILKSLVREVVEEQNEKLEQDLTDMIREEMEDLLIQLQQEAQEEAAASSEPGRLRTGFFGRLRKALKVLKSGQV